MGMGAEFEELKRGRKRSKLNLTPNLTRVFAMTKAAVTNFLLLVIAVAVIAIAVRPYIAPVPAEAQTTSAHPFYIEPGVQMLRKPDGSGQVFGKVVVDLRNGKVWGFPTGSPDPYPSHPMNNRPPVSRPFELGKFAFEDTDK